MSLPNRLAQFECSFITIGEGLDVIFAELLATLAPRLAQVGGYLPRAMASTSAMVGLSKRKAR